MRISHVKELRNGIELTLAGKGGRIRLLPVTENIIRCIYTKDRFHEPSCLVSVSAREKIPFTVKESKKSITLLLQKASAEINLSDGCLYFFESPGKHPTLVIPDMTLVPEDVTLYTTGDEPPEIRRVKTVDGERNFIGNLKAVTDRTAYRAKLCFSFGEDEAIHGLGQGEEGIYDYRHHNQYLYQHNMRIPMPVFISSKGYGVFTDCASLMTWNDDENGSYLFLDTVSQIDFYYLGGPSLDEVIRGYRTVTGKAAMLPKWAFGYIQSKEAYHTDRELADVAAHYRKLHVPIDCVVQDWNTWVPGQWGQKSPDPTRYGHLKECIDEMHKNHVHTMVSVWPNMSPGCPDHQEFAKHGELLNDYSTYNAFDEKARRRYWDQLRKSWWDSGIDSWWCDSTEPFSGPDWNGPVKREPWERFFLVGNEHKHYLDPSEANAYSLAHARGIFENQRKETKDKRVLNLTRSGYASGQKYGTVLWSGDTCARWSTLRTQITEGLNFSMSGMPYWTLDIGAFFTCGNEGWKKRGCSCNTNPDPLWFWQGEYSSGVRDPAYCELYVRWLEYGAFLPMFRSHGTDTPREIWNFGKKGSRFYDAIEKTIRLRYHLMPYIYSLAGDVCLNDGTMLRSLLFDFPDDPAACSVHDEFMFGPSLLVCPVTEPDARSREVYLPAGTQWYDYAAKHLYEGGQTIRAAAPLDRIPLFVRAGSVLPTADGLQYADEKNDRGITLEVWPGADALFEYYEDEGDGYGYEDGKYCVTPLLWDDRKKALTFGERQGSYEGTETFRVRIISPR